MRKMFIVFGKLLGLYVLCGAIPTLVEFFWGAVSLLTGANGFLGGLWVLLSSGAYSAVSLALALVLILKTERLADWVRLKKDEEPASPPSPHTMLVAGAALIGIYSVIFAIPSLVSELLRIRYYPKNWDRPDFVRNLVTYGLQLVLGAVLMVKAEAIAIFVEKRLPSGRHQPGSAGTEPPPSAPQ
jgi:hypothetical protein